MNMNQQNRKSLEVDSNPVSSRVGTDYHSYVTGCCQTVKINDPAYINYMPKSRFGHCASLVADRWFVLGGQPSTPAYIEEYDTLRETWHQHLTTGAVPSALHGVACSCIDGNKLYTFGGSTRDNKYTNVLSELDIATKVWRMLEPGQPHHTPILKRDTAMISHGRSQLVTFGGYGTFHEHVTRSRASYDKNGTKSEVWTNELIRYDLDKREAA